MPFLDEKQTIAQIAVLKARQKPQGIPVQDVPIGDYELLSLGAYERVRIDLAVSEPVLYTRMAEALERLANDFRGAAQARLPAPTDHNYQRERLMVMLMLQQRVTGVRKQLNDIWAKAKRSRGS